MVKVDIVDELHHQTTHSTLVKTFDIWWSVSATMVTLHTSVLVLETAGSYAGPTYCQINNSNMIHLSISKVLISSLF